LKRAAPKRLTATRAANNNRPLHAAGFTVSPTEPATLSHMIRHCTVAALLLMFSAAAAAQAPAPAGDPAKGREKTRMCEGCHGIEGWRTAYPEVYRVPKLGGQHAAYLAQALHEYKRGERSHPSMRAIAGSLSDEDIANLAAYYSKGGIQTASK
jgi:cytochrome c553